MATGQTSRVFTYLHRLPLLQECGGVTDAQLLERFLARREEIAFEELVRRHGPMVRGVCRRVLGESHAAADAFQATFLVLIRQAASIVPRSRVGPWLYGVARRTALKARSSTARRLRAEQEAARGRPHTTPPADLKSDLGPLLDEELGRLPEKYRAPLVLCLLQAKSRKEAAGLLGWSEGTLSGRLARAKVLLGKRLRRRGITLTSSAVLVALVEDAVAEVPVGLAISTAKCAVLLATPASATVIATPVVALTEEVLKTMLISKLKTVTGVLVLLAGIGLGATAARQYSPGAGVATPAATNARGKDKAAPLMKADPRAYVIEPPDILLVKYAPPDGADPVKIAGQCLVRPDGTIGLGPLGSVFVSGRTLEQVRPAVVEHLARHLDRFDPNLLTVEVAAYNSKVFYLIAEDPDGGDQVYRFPATGSETVLDAIGQANVSLVGLGQKQIWVERVSEDGKGSRVMDVDWREITQAGNTATNYVLRPGDRVRIKSVAPKTEGSRQTDTMKRANGDPVRELEALVEAFRQARSHEERQRAVERLEVLTKKLRRQLVE
jgi:RNA polymerase sigma factor (sigma-70 family)